jgi:myo-inositol-1(or 4)-monophosphatase
MCYVACGRIDAYWELSIKLWDIAASSLIVLEAGGTVRGIKGQPEFLVPPYALIASGPGVYDELLGEILKTP